MIRDIVASAWAQSPARVVIAILAAPVVVYVGWAWLVVMIEALS